MLTLRHQGLKEDTKELEIRTQGVKIIAIQEVELYKEKIKLESINCHIKHMFDLFNQGCNKA